MKKIRKSLRGYSPAAVRQLINEMQTEHEIRMAELREQSDWLDTERRRLEGELSGLTRAAGKQPAVLSDQMAAKRLLEAHLAQTETVWRTLQELKAQEDHLREMAALKQSERDVLLENAERRLKEALHEISEGREMT